MFKIGPVPQNRRRKAIDFIAAGAGKGPRRRITGDILNTWASRWDPQRLKLWWATRLRRPAAAIILAENPGRVGTVIFSSSTAPGVRHDALVELLRTVTDKAIADGLAIVQSQQESNRVKDIAALSEAGYFRLAELIYMEMHLDDIHDDANNAPQNSGSRFAWRDYNNFSESQLGELIAATYIDSLDCPAIVGLRNGNDIIATHKASGIFLPQSWWILECDGEPVGCVLTNDVSGSLSSEVVYMGVAPKFRGRGFGKIMINQAATDARKRNRQLLTLAVDTHNTPAKCVYDAAGFIETSRRLTCVATQKLP